MYINIVSHPRLFFPKKTRTAQHLQIIQRGKGLYTYIKI
jgi:hypothetical protein